jgi:hypothetical protein
MPHPRPVDYRRARQLNEKGPRWGPFHFWRWSESCAEDALRFFRPLLPYN